jgi:hypothetical protein
VLVVYGGMGRQAWVLAVCINSGNMNMPTTESLSARADDPESGDRAVARGCEPECEDSLLRSWRVLCAVVGALSTFLWQPPSGNGLRWQRSQDAAAVFNRTVSGSERVRATRKGQSPLTKADKYNVEALLPSEP